MMRGYVYILCNRKNGALYTGFTKSLYERVQEHKNKTNPKSHTAQYDIDRLVYFETYDLIREALRHEKQLKDWNRSWKIALIEKDNPEWREIVLDWRDLS
jgi:putative endonuclease